jgi:hypothetical protein
MNISDNSRKAIVEEIKYVAKMMDQSKDPVQKLYFFSGIYSIIQRTFNLECDSDLIFSHFILRQTYDAFNGRLQAIMKGGETLILLQEEHFKKLSQITKELAIKIQKNEDASETLKRFAVLSYTTTGNGYYLMQKGLLKIKDI